MWKSMLRFLKKLKSEVAYDPDVPLLGIQQKDSTSYHRNNCMFMSTADLFTVVRR